MSMEDACHWLGVGRTTFSKIISRGDIPFVPFNPDNPKSKKLILRSDLLRIWRRTRPNLLRNLKRNTMARAKIKEKKSPQVDINNNPFIARTANERIKVAQGMKIPKMLCGERYLKPQL